MGDVIDIKPNEPEAGLKELENLCEAIKECIKSGELCYFSAVFESPDGMGSLCLAGHDDDRLRAASTMNAFSTMIIDDVLGDSDDSKRPTTH